MAEENLPPDMAATPAPESYDSSISNTPTPEPTDAPDAPEPVDFEGFYGYSTSPKMDVSQTGTSLGQLPEYLNNPLDSNAYYNAAVAQSPWEALGNGLYRGVFGEIIGGTIAGFGALGNRSLWEGDYSERNLLERMGNAMMEGANEDAAIYERNPGAAFQWGDAAWWGKNLPSMMSTISMMIPGMAVGKGAGLVGKGLRMGAGAVQKAAKVGAKAEKVLGVAGDLFQEGLKTAGGAVAMRHAENMREAHGVFEQAKSEFLSDFKPVGAYKGTEAWKQFQEHIAKEEGKARKPTKAELADFVAAQAAKKTYAVNSYNLAFDMMQFHALGKMMKGTRGAFKGAAAARAAGATKGAVRMARLGGVAKFVALDMGTEGIEEMVNYVGTEEGMYNMRNSLGLEESRLEDRLKEYTDDDHFWESGFLGAIGGAVFTGVGGAVSKARNSKAQNELIEKAQARGRKLTSLAADADKASAGELTPQEAGVKRRKAMYDIGLEAAASGQADIVDSQIASYEQALVNEGMSAGEVAEASAEMREQLQLAEGAVKEAMTATKSKDLTKTERALLTQQITENQFVQQELKRRREELAPELANIKNREEQVQQIEREELEAVTNLLEVMEKEGVKVPDELKRRQAILQERVDKQPKEENNVEELKQKLKEAKEAERTRESLETAADEAVAKEVGAQRIAGLEQAIADAEAGKTKKEKVEVNSNLEEFVNSEIDTELLQEARAELTTDKGLEKLTTLAKKVDDVMEVRNDKEFRELVDNMRDQKELKRLHKKAETEAKKDYIDNRIKTLQIQEANEKAADSQQRSKDVVVPGPTQELVDQLLANSDNVSLNSLTDEARSELTAELTALETVVSPTAEQVNRRTEIEKILEEENKYYVDSRTGKRYMRTTTWMNMGRETTISREWGIPSSNIGNSVDEYVRDFFNGDIRNPEAYPHLPADLQAVLREQLKTLEAQFVANGEKVIAKDVVLFHDLEVSDSQAEGVAGTVDLLTVDKDGNFRIYDMKTIRGALTKRAFGSQKIHIGQKGNVDYGEAAGDLKQKHRMQLSTYRMMLMNQLGVQVPQVGIIPIDVSYDTDSRLSDAELNEIVTSRADYLGGVIWQRPMASWNGMTEPKDVIDTDDVPDEPANPKQHLIDRHTESISKEKAKHAAALELLQELRKSESTETELYDAYKQQMLDAVNEIARLNKLITRYGGSLVPFSDPGLDPIIDTEGETGKEKKEEEEEPNNSSPNIELSANEVSVPLSTLVSYFATRLTTIKEPGREQGPYLVHAHTGPLQMSGDNLAAYQALMSVLDGSNTENITFEVEQTGNAGLPVTVFSGLEGEKGPLTSTNRTDRKGKIVPEYTYNPTAADGLQVVMKIGGVTIGTLPTAGEAFSSAHLAGQASMTTNKFAQKSFAEGSRAGQPVIAGENSAMMMQQEASLENALNIHALREALHEASKQGASVVSIKLRAGATQSGQVAQGGLIYSTGQGAMGSEFQTLRNSILTHGLALQLPSTSKGKQQVETQSGLIVSAYQQNVEYNGNASSDTVPPWNSGALYVPIENNGEVLWVRVPGRSLSQLRSSDEIIKNVQETLESGNEQLINELQNVLGSRALQQDKNGVWHIYANNITGQQVEPISSLRNGSWTTDLTGIVPNMIFDVAVVTSEETPSAFKDPSRALGIGKMEWDNLATFVAEEVGIGYEPVVDENGDVTGWTHTLAPVYPGRDTKGGSQQTRFVNQNTADTQLVIAVEPVSAEVSEEQKKKKLSGKELDKKLDDALKPTPKPASKSSKQGTIDLDALNKRFDSLSKFVDDKLGDDDTPIWFTQAAAESSNNAEKATKADMEQAEEWWAQNVPNVPFKRVSGIIRRNGTTGYGIFEKGAVQVSDIAVVGTEFHEAFHAVFQMFLPDERQAKVLADAKRVFGEKSAELLEEDLAESFREYMLTKGLSMKDKSVVRRFFSELAALIEALITEGFSGYRRMRLFNKINSGGFANNDAKVREYATRNRLIMAEIPEFNSKVQEELNTMLKNGAFRALRHVQDGKGTPEMKAAYAELVKHYNTAESELQEEGVLRAGETKAEFITKNMLNLGIVPVIQDGRRVGRFNEDLRPRILQLFDNKQAIIDFFTAEPGMQKHVMALMDQEFTAGTESEVQYDETFERMNPKDSLSQTVKSLIETTPMMSIETFNNGSEIRSLMAAATMALQAGNPEQARANVQQIIQRVGESPTQSYFGLPQMMNVDLVFPFLSERLASKASPEEMYAELDRIGTVYPEFRLLALRLQQEPNWVQAQFFSGMRRGETAELIQESSGYIAENSTFSSVLFTYNSQRIQTHLRDLARKNGKTVAQMSDAFANRVQGLSKDLTSMTDKQFVESSIRLLDAIGFGTKDAKARNRVLALGASDVEFRKNLFAFAGNTLRNFSNIAEVSETENPESRKKFNANLKGLTNLFAPYDMGAVATTFTNVEGSRIYSKQVPSFITEWFDQFDAGRLSKAELEAKLRKEVFADERMYATTYGRLLFPQGKDGRFIDTALKAGAVRAYRVGGIDRGDGTTYTDMTEAQWFEFQLRALQSRINGIVYLPITTPSDASNSYMVPAIRYNMSDTSGSSQAKTAVHGLIKAEIQEMQIRGGRFALKEVEDFMAGKLQRDSDGVILDKVVPEAILAEAATIAMEALEKEGKAISRLEQFSDAVDAVANEDTTPERRQQMAHNLVVAGYISNMSTAIAMAGTHNEFKNTVDMQKRHKQIISPGLTNAGVSGKSHFRSVTLAETVLDLQSFNDALPDNYKKVEVADAQSYVSPEFYKTILLEHGDIAPEMEVAIDKAIAGEKLDPAEVKLLRPYKPFYYSRALDKNTGLLTSYQIKNSIIPVIKGLSEDFDKFNDWLRDNKIDQVQMESAHKVGKNERKLVELRDKETGAFNGKKLSESQQKTHVHVLPMNGYRKQVNVTDHWNSNSTNKLASQLEKIVVAGAVRKMGEEGKQIAEEFLSTLDKIYKKQKDDFFGRFKVEFGSDIMDNKEFQEWLRNELISDESTPQYMIDLVEQGLFTAPAVVGAMRSRVFSAIQRDVNTVRVAGGTQVQIASQFFRRNKNEEGKITRLRGMRKETVAGDGTVSNPESKFAEMAAKAANSQGFKVIDEGSETPRTITTEDLLKYEKPGVEPKGLAFVGLNRKNEAVTTDITSVLDNSVNVMFKEFAAENRLENVFLLVNSYAEMMEELNDADNEGDPSIDNLRMFHDAIFAVGETTEVIRPAEIAVSRDFLPTKYRDMSIAEIKATAPEVLKSITLRIPSEAMNSGSVVEVVDFLPEGMDGVIVPDEFVTQMGSDFDVDKLFFQFRESGDKGKLFDLQVKVFEDQRMLSDIIEPQGFDGLAAKAKDPKYKVRNEAQEDFIRDNPMSVATQGWMRGDNMAGVALKGQAANKNIIFLDLVRYGWKWENENYQINGASVSFDGYKVSDAVVRIHAEAVAAAMDGAKDPVYGKLGITNKNFGMFMELVMIADNTLATTKEQTRDQRISELLDFALDIIQSKPGLLMANGHISINGGKLVTVTANTEKGKAFLAEVNYSFDGAEVKNEGTVMTLPSNGNLFSGKNKFAEGKSLGLLTAAIGTWKSEVSNNLSYVNDVMRLDKANVRESIEDVLTMTSSQFGIYGELRNGFNRTSEKQTSVPFVGSLHNMHVKGVMYDMFGDTARMLAFAGDGFLMFKGIMASNFPKVAAAMNMEAYDAKKRDIAAAEFAYEQVYTAMGERDTRAPKALSEDRSEWSLENWLRYFATSEELETNEDLNLVVGKLLVQTNPYTVNGKYFDNITLIGVSDDSELKQLTDAMERLDNSNNPDIFDFVGAIQMYEAQRSRYQTSLGRMTKILPSRVQVALGSQIGADGTLDILSSQEDFWDIVAHTAHNPNLPYLSAKTLDEAILKAENKKQGGSYRTLDGHVLIPVSETDEGVGYKAVKSPNADGKNRAQKFSGKPVDMDLSTDQDSYGLTEGVDYESRLGWYKPEHDVETKVQMLQERFRKSGVAVKVVLDSQLSSKGAVKIDKGTATVYIHPDKLQGDTIAHEFGHILLEALGYGNELVQQAIGELKGTELYEKVKETYPDLSERDLEMEVLTTWIGRRGTEMVTDQKGKLSKLRTLYNRIMRAIGKLFGIQPKATEQLAQELMFGEGELSLDDKLNTYQEQRGTQTASDIIKTTGQNLKDRMNYIRRTQGTSVEAQEALAEARARYQSATGGVVIDRLKAIANMSDDTVSAAAEAAVALDGLSMGMRTQRTMNEGEVVALRRADQTLNDVETLLNSLDNMETLKKPLEEMTEQEVSFQELADKIDLLREAKNNLTAAVSQALSNKLKANSTNSKFLEELGDGNMFAIASNPQLRGMMTDVDSISKGALGVKEFKNPVVQSIAKLVADTLETSRLDAKQDEGKVSKILDEFIAQGGKLADIVDMETGAFKGEYNADYYRLRKEAEKESLKPGGDKLALLRFDTVNTVQEFTSEYYKNWVIKSSRIQTLRDKIRRDEGLIKAGFKRAEIRERITANRKEFAELMQTSADDFIKYHTVEVAEGFDAAYQTAADKTEAAKKLAKEAGEKAGPDVFALRNFIADNVVINVNGKNIPTRGEFAVVKEKEQYKNPEYSGNPKPGAKYVNKSWESNPHKDVINGLKEAMSNAAGAPGQSFVEQGFLPINFSSQAQLSTKEKLEREGKKLKTAATDAAKAALGDTAKMFGNEVELDSRGNRIYVRATGLFSQPTDEQIEELQGMSLEDVGKRIKQFVKDGHQESAKRALEPVAYLTREVFEGSEIIDGKHVLKPGKKGDGMREATKLAKGTSIANALDQWFEGVLGDKWEDPTAMDALAGQIQKYTSLMGVGLNIPAWINNYAYGSLQRHLEFKGRDHFSKENSRKGHKLISGNFTTIMRDLVKDHGGKFDNKISALVHTLDVADDQRELPFNQKESMANKLMSKAFIGQTMGEIAMQNQVLFAMMLETEVKLADDTTTNLLEAYQLEDGVLKLPEGAKVMTAQGEMVDLDNKFVARFRNKVKSINHYIHGAYNKQDAGTWQRHWVGRLGMQFRRWLPMGVKKRFGDRMYNESREREEIGEYRALVEITKAILGDVQKGKNLKEALASLKETDPVAYQASMKALREVAISAGLFFLLAGLYAFGFDEEDEFGVLGALAINRTERLAQEMMTYTPMGLVNLFNETSASPLASWGKLQTAGDFLLYGGQDAMSIMGLADRALYTSGERKGQSKTWRRLEAMLPVLGHRRRFMEMEQNHKQYSMLWNFIH